MQSSLIASTRYRSFVKDRDLALERIHQHMLIDLSRILYNGLQQIEHLTASLALRSHGGLAMIHTLGAHYENGVKEILTQVWRPLVMRIQSMRKAAFILTYASEQEAIGRATQRSNRVSRAEFKMKLRQAINQPTLLDQKLEARVWVDLMRLRHRIIQAFELALIQELKPNEIVAAVTAKFPKAKKYKRPPRALTPLREAAKVQADKDIYQFDFVDDTDWDDMVDSYTETELQPNRFDNVTQYNDPDDSQTAYYSWELEQDATDDFVNSVRDGQVEAATDLGVKDFVWIAVIDDKTDTCCLKRHGKTTSEIEDMLDSGQLDPDDCDASTPPAHFNCRCQIGPVASTDEVEGPDWESFNDWLET